MNAKSASRSLNRRHFLKTALVAGTGPLILRSSLFATEVAPSKQVTLGFIGLGAQGALLGIRSQRQMVRFPAVYTRPIVSTIGAGDALFSAFLHSYLHNENPELALQKAIVFASYKIGETSAAEGFLNASSLEDWIQKTMG